MMKKFFLTTTALIATAGMASADITISGRAEMGIHGGNTDNTMTAGVDESQTRFFTDIDVTFTMTGETDGGLSFGAAVDLDEGGAGAAAVANNDDDGGIAIFISGNFGTVTMGDTDGALDWALTEAGNVNNGGSIADDETSHSGYLGAYGDGYGDGQIVRYDNTFGDFGVAVSLEQTTTAVANTETGYAIGFKYNFAFTGGSVDLGLGFQRAYTRLGGLSFYNTNSGMAGGNEVDILGASVAVNLDNGLSMAIQYAEFESNTFGDGWEHVGVGIGYTTGDLTVHANWGEFSSSSVGTFDNNSGYGLSAAYDLGGGAVIHAGWSRSDNAIAPTNTDRFSLGLGLSF